MYTVELWLLRYTTFFLTTRTHWGVKGEEKGEARGN